MPQYSEKDIEILISTMNRTNLDFLFQMLPNDLWKKVNILIIHQSKKNSLISDFQNIKIINSNHFGLSKSRNIGLKNATGKLLYISDDDVIFASDFIENITSGFQQLNSDFIIFQYTKNGKLAKNYPSEKQQNTSWTKLLSSSSVEIVMKREIFLKNQIFFDTHFGINALFGMGEEAIFLADYKKKGSKIGFFPKTITHHDQATTSERTCVKTIYYRCGAIFYRIFGRKYWLWIFIKMTFDLKQNKISLWNTISLFKQAQKGKQDYLALKNGFPKS